jgi:DNA-binding FrmR family transcriptional regulator
MKSDIKKRALHRAKILEGQMRALAKAIEKEEYCIDLLLQSLSIKQSLKSLEGLLLENHIRTHLKHQLRKAGGEAAAVKELVKIYSLQK